MTAATTALRVPLARRSAEEILRSATRAAVREVSVELRAMAPRPPADEPWIDPQVVAMSMQRGDGEWRYCPWLMSGRDDLYDEAC